MSESGEDNGRDVVRVEGLCKNPRRVTSMSESGEDNGRDVGQRITDSENCWGYDLREEVERSEMYRLPIGGWR